VTSSISDAYTPPAPVQRQLRGYALDPSLTQSLVTAEVGHVVFHVPWEPLAPGPVGEYLEVVDYDPASNCFYPPVPLDHPNLLAQDGLPPTEGSAQFHQQMVYAVASATIHNFERALGRRALWSPGPPPDSTNKKDDSHFVQRLRIYPHALREANAYFSPARKALLFGYFQAATDDPARHVPGSMVFTSLSHDIIAHETAHALLDGMHRRLTFPTNPDILAFHEAFADIVALLQHFDMAEVLRHQIATTRGDIRAQENLLGQLAVQFGRASGARGALRDFIGREDPDTHQWIPHEPDPTEYETELEPHGRGAILVAAIFDAFLSIYGARVADLLRLSSGGTGILPAGAVHPDLVNRLCEEARKTAHHVLTICVRALDYCPPVDLTFGEYLRALITADFDLVRDDDRNYRVAFIEAFRRRGLYPRDLRTLSVDDLRWCAAADDEVRPSAVLLERIRELRAAASGSLFARSREEVFHHERTLRRDLHDWLDDHLKKSADGARDAAFLGLEPKRSFEVHAAHFATRAGPDGDVLHQFIMQLIQERPLTARGADRTRLRFSGGSTVIADLESANISYCIRKPISSTTREARQLQYMERRASSLRATYFRSDEPGAEPEPFALLHRGLQ
jgi:hypothetical protein